MKYTREKVLNRIGRRLNFIRDKPCHKNSPYFFRWRGSFGSIRKLARSSTLVILCLGFSWCFQCLWRSCYWELGGNLTPMLGEGEGGFGCLLLCEWSDQFEKSKSLRERKFQSVGKKDTILNILFSCPAVSSYFKIESLLCSA